MKTIRRISNILLIGCILLVICLFGISFIENKLIKYNFTKTSNDKYIEIKFHMNTDKLDSIVTQKFYLGNNYNSKTKKGNKFGYNTNGTSIKKVGDWSRDGYTLMGWAHTHDSLTKAYEINNEVSDDFINSMLDTDNTSLDLYAVWAKDVDLGLFWGQSNMVGYVGSFPSELEKDTRDITGLIDSDIISQYQAMSYVSVPVKEGTAYDFKIDNNGNGYLDEITSKTRTLGEYSCYYEDKLVSCNSSINYCSLEASMGTNLIPQFAKTYNEKTGHVLVSVMAANGGEWITNFLPHSDPLNDDNQYIYEALVSKYLLAVDYLENHGYIVKNRFYVVYQGCADTYASLTGRELYYDNFLKVHNNIKNDLGISFGALIETSGDIRSQENEKLFQGIKNIHEQQEKLVSDNDDIILGSDLGYKAFINKNENIFASTNSTGGADNSIHLTSASLSQIGKDTATKVAKRIK